MAKKQSIIAPRPGRHTSGSQRSPELEPLAPPRMRRLLITAAEMPSHKRTGDNGVVKSLPCERFTISGIWSGARASVALALSDAAYGIVFGVLARQVGLSLPEAVLMSGLVFAGSAQLVALSLWATPVPVLTLVLSTLIVNLRYLMMGATLRPWFKRLSTVKAYGSLFFLSDESWALSVSAFEREERDRAFLLGSGIAIFVAWTGATATGYLAGAIIRDPAAWGLDFIFVAVFVALLAGMFRGRRDLLPWIVAATAAAVTAHDLPGKWFILAGGIAGSIVGGFNLEH